MNALELLKRDHDSITALLAGANAYTDMKWLFERIKSELESHAHIEETAFYPLLQKGSACIDQRAALRLGKTRRSGI